jgi:pimeloyl-ACP methyl ester carboxylesterase
MSGADSTVQWLDRGDGQRLAWQQVAGSGPGIVFLGGYGSDMTGTKASFLDGWCRSRGRAFLRFDYLGHGASSGRFEDGTLSRWRDDALAVLDHLTEGPQILVGSSMGGWIMLLLALAQPQRVAGLVGIAAAPDFSQDIWWSLTAAQQDRLLAEGLIEVSDDGALFTVTRDFIEDGRRHLLLRGPIAVAAPTRLLQGMNDSSVPWPTAHRVADLLAGDDVVVSLVKDGDHRLSRDEDLARLGATLEELSATVAGGA